MAQIEKPRIRVPARSAPSPALVTRGEGDYRPGPWYLPFSGGWLSADVGANLNWWQLGYDIQSGSRSALVGACISAYAQTVAMCPGDHWWLNDDGGRERVTTSALSRILKRPNAYQSISDFLLDAVTDLYSDGNTYALALRNDRYEIEELHLMVARQCSAQVAQGGEVFYALAGNEVIDKMLAPDYRLLVPARDVLHIRLGTSEHNMLLGESPLVTAARDIATGDAILAQQLQFYLNQARPSTVLTTDLILDPAQVTIIRESWNEQSRGLNTGGTPILSAGLKPQRLTATAEDSQLADVLKMSRENIALAFRVPLQILGLGGAPISSTEALMQYWLATSLGFCLNHVEEAIGNLFRLKGQPEEYVEFDTSALLRTAFKDRIDALVRGVQGTVFSPDEARAFEGYPKVKGGFGEEPRAQQQLVPLSAAAAIPAAPSPPAQPSAGPVELSPPKETSNDDLIKSFLRTADKYDRRDARRVS